MEKKPHRGRFGDYLADIYNNNHRKDNSALNIHLNLFAHIKSQYCVTLCEDHRRDNETLMGSQHVEQYSAIILR